MNLSSCVADSVVLSFDSAGQTLGSGTNPSLSILSALSTWPHMKWSLVRLRGGYLGMAVEYLRMVGKSSEAFLGTHGLEGGCNIQKTLPVALKVGTGGLWVDAPSSFRVFQAHIKGMCFLSTYPGPESGAEGIERPQALGMLEKIIIRALQQSVRLMRV